MPALGPLLGERCAALHRAHGVDLRLGRGHRRSARRRTAASAPSSSLTARVHEADVVVDRSRRGALHGLARRQRSCRRAWSSLRRDADRRRRSRPPGRRRRRRVAASACRRPSRFGSSTGRTPPSRGRIAGRNAVLAAARPGALRRDPVVLVGSVRDQDPGARPAAPGGPATTSSRSPTTAPGSSRSPSVDGALDRRGRRVRRRRDASPTTAAGSASRSISNALRRRARRGPAGTRRPPRVACATERKRREQTLAACLTRSTSRTRTSSPPSVPYEVFAVLRREDPVHFNPERDRPGLLGRDALRGHPHRPSRRRDLLVGDRRDHARGPRRPSSIEARKPMIDMDPPRHDELRAIVNRRFTPRRGERVGGPGRAERRHARCSIEALPLGEFDFVEQISSEIPMRVFADIMGIPQEERREIIRAREPARRPAGPRVRGRAGRGGPDAAVLEPGRARDVRDRAPARGFAPRRPTRRSRHAARLRAADGARVRPLLRAARGGRERDDPAHDLVRPAGPARASRSARALAPRARSSCRRPSRRSCAGPRRCCTSAGPRRGTSSSGGRRSRRETRLRPGSCRGTATRTCFPIGRHVRRRPFAQSAHRPSGPAESTTASARTWPDSRSGSRSRSS